MRQLAAMSSRISRLFMFTTLLAGGCLGDPRQADDQSPLEEISRSIAFGGHDYRFFTTPKNWSDARAVCVSMGSHLVSVDNATEESFLADEEWAHGGSTWWLGLNDTGVTSGEGEFRWESGAFLGYVNFAPGQPDNRGNQDCVYDGFTNGQWDDYDCNAQLRFICESNTVPTVNDGTFSFNTTNTNNALQNVTAWAIDLNPGQGIQVGTCGVPGGTYLGDTFLRVYNPTGQQIAFNDDACFGNSGSNISFAATSTTRGTYIVRAGCFANTACSGTVAFKR